MIAHTIAPEVETVAALEAAASVESVIAAAEKAEDALALAIVEAGEAVESDASRKAATVAARQVAALAARAAIDSAIAGVEAKETAREAAAQKNLAARLEFMRNLEVQNSPAVAAKLAWLDGEIAKAEAPLAPVFHVELVDPSPEQQAEFDADFTLSPEAEAHHASLENMLAGIRDACAATLNESRRAIAAAFKANDSRFIPLPVAS